MYISATLFDDASSDGNKLGGCRALPSPPLLFLRRRCQYQKAPPAAAIAATATAMPIPAAAPAERPLFDAFDVLVEAWDVAATLVLVGVLALAPLVLVASPLLLLVVVVVTRSLGSYTSLTAHALIPSALVKTTSLVESSLVTSRVTTSVPALHVHHWLDQSVSVMLALHVNDTLLTTGQHVTVVMLVATAFRQAV